MKNLVRRSEVFGRGLLKLPFLHWPAMPHQARQNKIYPPSSKQIEQDAKQEAGAIKSVFPKFIEQDAKQGPSSQFTGGGWVRAVKPSDGIDLA